MRTEPTARDAAASAMNRKPPNGASEGTIDAMNSTLADRLNKLFAVMHRAGEPPLSNAAATEAMTRRTGVSFNHNDLEQWRAGMRIDATGEQLEAIAKYFGVPTVYLTDPTDEVVDAQLNVLRAMRGSGGVVQCHRNVKTITPQVLNSLAEIVNRSM